MLVGMLGSLAGAEVLDSWDLGSLSNIAESATHDTFGEVVLNKTSVHTDGDDWLSSLIYVELASGSVVPPQTDPFPWAYTPGVNDAGTWLPDDVAIMTGADELAGFDGMSGDPANAALSITIVADLAADPVPPWDGLVAQIAFTDDAQGRWAYKVNIKGRDPQIFTGPRHRRRDGDSRTGHHRPIARRPRRTLRPSPQVSGASTRDKSERGRGSFP